MLNSRLCDYSFAYIIVKVTLKFVGEVADTAVRAANKNNKQVIFKNCPLYIDCISEINNIQVDNANCDSNV